MDWVEGKPLATFINQFKRQRKKCVCEDIGEYIAQIARGFLT
jgi:hypothetical protein